MKTQKISANDIWDICRWVRYANMDMELSGRVGDFSKSQIKMYVNRMIACGIKVDRSRIYETRRLLQEPDKDVCQSYDCVRH